MRATTTRSRAGRRLARGRRDLRRRGPGRTGRPVRVAVRADRREDRGEADGYKKAYVAAAKNQRSAAQGSGTIFKADGSHIHTGNRRRTRARPQRPAHEERRLPGRGDHQPRDRGPDHTRPGPLGGGCRGGAALRRPSRSSPTSPSSASHASSPTNRYNMFNACYGIQSARTSRWLTGATYADLHGDLDRCRSPAVLQANGARALHALQPREDLPRRRPARRELRGQPGPEQQLGRHDAAEGPLPSPDPRARAT